MKLVSSVTMDPVHHEVLGANLEVDLLNRLQHFPCPLGPQRPEVIQHVHLHRLLQLRDFLL